jgi:hypothetical protein
MDQRHPAIVAGEAARHLEIADADPGHHRPQRLARYQTDRGA